MTDESLEQRVARLEEQMRRVLRMCAVGGCPQQFKDWRRTAGMFRNDPIMAVIIEAGRRIWEDDRQQATES